MDVETRGSDCQPNANDLPLDSTTLSDRLSIGTSNDYYGRPTGWREWLFIIVLCSTQYLTQSALGYILLPLSIVSRTFDQVGPEQAAEMNWHVAGYSLTVGTFILVAGKLGDIYGSRNVFLVGWLWFGVWSVVCGCSALTGSAVFFDITRALQGIGPAMLLPNGLAIAGRTYPPGRRKNIVFALIAMCAPLGCSTSSLIAGALAQYVWWPWTIWIYSVGCFIVAALAFFVVPKDRKRASTKSIAFDWLGAILGVAGLLLLNISWNQAPIDGWSRPYVIVLLILGFVFVYLFTLQQKWVEQPLLDLSIFNGRVAGILVTTGLGWASFGIWFYYLFQFIQNMRHVSALDSALQFLPGAISGMLAAIVTGWLLEHLQTAWLMVLACSAFFLGCLLMATAPVQQSYWFNTFWSFVIMAWGMDVSFPATTLSLSDAVPVEHQGVSASLANTVVNYSIAIGLGIAGTVEAEVSPKGSDMLKGYRAAQYTSVGLAGCGLGISISLALWRRKT